MNIIKRCFSSFAAFMSARPNSDQKQHSFASNENSEAKLRAPKKTGNFDGDYRSATAMLRERISERFPDNFHARVGSQTNSTRDYGDERAGAIDMTSAAIATALRNGATVKQAAEAGAASVGI